MIDEDSLQERKAAMLPHLDERQPRLGGGSGTQERRGLTMPVFLSCGIVPRF
jgi:hypothetical protein